MDTEQLDSLLDSSVPPARRLDPVDVRAMVADAREQLAPTRRRRYSVGLGAAAALALVIGGGGVAVASGLISWPSELEHPDGAYAFTLPSGRACEVRLIVDDYTSDEDPSEDRDLQRAIQNDIAEWLRSGALDRDLDLDAADADAARILAEQDREYGMTVLIADDGSLTDHLTVPGRPDADDARAFAVNLAVTAAMTSHLRDAGYPEETWTFGTDGGVKCAAE